MYPPGQPHPQQPGYGYPAQGPAPYPGQAPYGPPMAQGGYQYPLPPGYSGGYAGPELASWGRRVGGYLIDVVVITLLIACWFALVLTVSIELSNALESADAGGNTPGVVLALLVFLIYGGAFAIAFCYRWLSHANSGKTLGKRAVGIRLVKETTGQPPGKGVSAGRELIIVAFSFVTCVGGVLVDLLWPLWDDKNQTLHDKAVGGIVIRE